MNPLIKKTTRRRVIARRRVGFYMLICVSEFQLIHNPEIPDKSGEDVFIADVL